MFWIFVSCLWSDQTEFVALLWLLISGFDQALFLSLVVNFNFFSSHCPLTTLGLHLLSDTYLTKLLFLWCPVTENNLI